MKIKPFAAREIQYFELGIFSFNSYVHYLTRGFIASTRAFNLPIRAFNLATRAFSLLTREFELLTREFELVTRNSCFTFPFCMFPCAPPNPHWNRLNIIKCCYSKKVFPFKFSDCIWNHSYISIRKGNCDYFGFFQKGSKHSRSTAWCAFLGMRQIFLFFSLFEIDASSMLVVAFSKILIYSCGNVFW